MSLRCETDRRSMNIGRLWAWCCAAAALLTACGEASAPGDGVVVRDSAGVTIVENGGDVWSAPAIWRLAPDPLARIGVAEGDEPYLLDGVRGVLALRDGSVVVANGGDHTLRWYDPAGAFLFQRGGEGAGPGEFARLGGIALGAADTVMAVDWSARRLTLFTADGTFAGTRPIEGLTGPPGRAYRLTDGSLVTGISGFSTAQLGGDFEPRRLRLSSPLLRLGADGERVDTIGMFPGEDIEIMAMGESFMFGNPPFGRRLSYAAAGNDIYVGTQVAFAIDVFSPDGRLVRSIRAPAARMLTGPELSAAWDALVRQRMEDVPPEERAEAERRAAQTELPEAAPAYTDFVIDDTNNLWVAEYRPDQSSPEQWVVFSPDGRLVTRVTVPPSFRVMAVRDGRVLGRATDDLGVQQVVAYSLEKG